MVYDFLEALGIQDYFDRYGRYILLSSILIIGFVSGYFIYNSYTFAREQKAFVVYQLCMNEFLLAEKNPTLWQNLEIAAKSAYQQNSGSALAPYFLALQAEALLRQSQEIAAINLLELMLNKISTHSPFYYNYALKLALIKIDQEDPALHQQGVQALESLAHDLKNTQRDQALFELSSYFSATNNNEQATKVLQELSTSFPLQGLEGSSWAEQAATLLKK